MMHVSFSFRRVVFFPGGYIESYGSTEQSGSVEYHRCNDQLLYQKCAVTCDVTPVSKFVEACSAGLLCPSDLFALCCPTLYLPP